MALLLYMPWWNVSSSVCYILVTAGKCSLYLISQIPPGLMYVKICGIDRDCPRLGLRTSHRHIWTKSIAVAASFRFQTKAFQSSCEKVFPRRIRDGYRAALRLYLASRIRPYQDPNNYWDFSALEAVCGRVRHLLSESLMCLYDRGRL